MYRRLFFVFPDKVHTEQALDELHMSGIGQRYIHVHANPAVDIGKLPSADATVMREASGQTERVLWGGNLLLFFVAFVVFIVMLFSNVGFWATIPLLVMLSTFFAGVFFTQKIPNVHLNEFTDALSHGEIVLMVDVPTSRVDDIEHLIHNHHPEAAIGGSSWTMAVSH